MKKTPKGKSSKVDPDEIKAEYKLDYSKAKPNRFAFQNQAGCRVVVLDPDTARVFTSDEAVNAVLRALISTMPKPATEDHAA